MRQDFVINFDGSGGVAGLKLVFGGYHGHFRSGPLNFGPGFGDDADTRHPRHLLGGAGVDTADLRVRVRAGQHDRVEKSLRVHVGRILGAAAGLVDTVQAVDPRPMILRLL